MWASIGELFWKFSTLSRALIRVSIRDFDMGISMHTLIWVLTWASMYLSA